MPEKYLAHDESGKTESILHACKNRDLETLRELAGSLGGLVDDEVRRTAWPILLASNNSIDDHSSDWKDLPQHRDEEQVALDVDRSFVYYPTGDSEKMKDARKHELSDVIIGLLRRHPMLHYFQGYHDIVQVLLLVLGVNAAAPAVARLSLLRIRDFMLPTMSGTEPHLQLLPSILYAADPDLAKHLSQTQPFFALPATLTLYAHQIEEYSSIARLFDFLLASEAVVPIYLFAAVVVSRKDQLLDIEAEEPEMLHSTLSKLPDPLDLEALISHAKQLFYTHPPERLPGRVWSRISTSSVLKTTRDFQALHKQRLHDGERFFEMEADEIRRRDAQLARQRQLRAMVRKYRTPITYTGMTVFIAVIAVAFGRYNIPLTLHSMNGAWFGLPERIVDLWKRFIV